MLSDRDLHFQTEFQVRNGFIIKPKRRGVIRREIRNIPNPRTGQMKISFFYFFKNVDFDGEIRQKMNYGMNIETEMSNNTGRINIYRTIGLYPIVHICFGSNSSVGCGVHELKVFTYLGNARDILRCTKQSFSCPQLSCNIEASYPSNCFNSGVKHCELVLASNAFYTNDPNKIRFIRSGTVHPHLRINVQKNNKITYFNVSSLRYHKSFRLDHEPALYPKFETSYIVESNIYYSITCFMGRDNESVTFFKQKPRPETIENGIRCEFFAFIRSYIIPDTVVKYNPEYVVFSEGELTHLNRVFDVSIDELIDPTNNNGDDLVVNVSNYNNITRLDWRNRVLYSDCHGIQHNGNDSDWNELMLIIGISKMLNIHPLAYILRLTCNYLSPIWKFTKLDMGNVPDFLDVADQRLPMGQFRAMRDEE